MERDRAPQPQPALLASKASRALHLHDLGFFSLQRSVHLGDVLVGQLLHSGLGAARIVLGQAVVLLGLLDGAVRVAADVAQGDARLLGRVTAL